jgi:hypothetical protein
MLRTLKSAVEAFLDTDICYSDIVLPDPDTQIYQRDVISKAINTVGLRQSLQILRAGKLAVYANDRDSDSERECPEQVVLAIDFSGYGLNAVLFHDDYGVYDSIRQIYKPDIGGDITSIINILRDFVQPPFADDLPDHISWLVLYGTMSSDKQFLEGLREMLDAGVIDNAQA